jgi:hypothetical protein
VVKEFRQNGIASFMLENLIAHLTSSDNQVPTFKDISRIFMKDICWHYKLDPAGLPVYFQTKKPAIWLIFVVPCKWTMLEDNWSILRSFDTFYSYLVHFIAIWYILW